MTYQNLLGFSSIHSTPRQGGSRFEIIATDRSKSARPNGLKRTHRLNEGEGHAAPQMDASYFDPWCWVKRHGRNAMIGLPAIDGYTIQELRRKARTARLQANRASPKLALELASLAALLEADAEARSGGRAANGDGQ